MVNRRERYRFLSTPSARRATRQIFHRAVGELISIHALREEGDLTAFNAGALHFNFYPRPPRGGRLQGAWNWRECVLISIHALREEGDSSQ